MAKENLISVNDEEYELLAWMLSECAVPEHLQVARRTLRKKVEQS
jgi:hypothetical protein